MDLKLWIAHTRKYWHSSRCYYFSLLLPSVSANQRVAYKLASQEYLGCTRDQPMPGPFRAPPIFRGKSPGDEVTKWPHMVKIRGILNARTLNVLEEEQGQSYIKSKLQFFLLSVCGAMMRFSSRNTSLWRHNDDWDGVCTINHRNHRILYRKLM